MSSLTFMKRAQHLCIGIFVLFRPPEMCDQYSKHKVNEKVDIWALGCILYTLIYKRHPFQDSQKLTIINAHYYCPEVNYSEKMIDLIRVMLSPNPEKRPEIKKILQILQNWNNIENIELSKEVQEIKAKHLDANKKSKYTLENLSEEALMKVQKEKNQFQGGINDIIKEKKDALQKESSSKGTDLIDWTNSEQYKNNNIERKSSLENNFQNFEFVEEGKKAEAIDFDLNEMQFVTSSANEPQKNEINEDSHQKKNIQVKSGNNQTIYDFF